MAKLFSVLTLLAAIAAIFFGFQSKDLISKIQSAAEREHTDKLTAVDKQKKAEKDLVEAKKEVDEAKTEAAAAKEALPKLQDDLKKVTADLAAASDAKSTAETQYNTVKKQLEELTVLLNGKSIEELIKNVNDADAMKKELTAKVTDMQSKVAELDTVNKTMIAQKRATESEISTKNKTIDRYKKNIMQNGVRGHVLAVNSGWGFCVLSLGDRQGAAANKTLVVARNGQSIGKVKIINVEASQSVADIIPSSFVRGTYVEPGDDVIYTGEDKVREEIAPETPAGMTAPSGSPSSIPAGIPALPLR